MKDTEQEICLRRWGALKEQKLGAAMPQAAEDNALVGKITEVVGDAIVRHKDGSEIKADVGVEIHQGDMVETGAKGALSILFSDNTTFAVSEGAKFSVDKFFYDAAEHKGTSFFSVFEGVFVYTSGLIGKDDPGKVNIETPVGSIGIRGTVVAGDINPAGEKSTITVVDGAIVITNAGGTLEMSDAFDTAVLTSYEAPATDSGHMTPQTFTTTYSAVQPVAESTFSALAGTGGETPSPDAQGTDGAVTAPEGTEGSATTPGGTEAAPVPGTPTDPAAPVPQDTQPPADDASAAPQDVPLLQLLESPLPATLEAATFTDNTLNFDTTAALPGTTSTSTASGTGGGTGGSTGGTSGTGSAGSTTGGGGSGYTVPTAQMTFQNVYTHGTPEFTDDGLSGKSIEQWLTATPGTPLLVGQVMTNMLGAKVFSVTGTGGTTTSGDNITGNHLEYNASFGTAANATGTGTIFHIDSSTGQIYLDDPAAVLANRNGNFTFDVTVSNGADSVVVPVVIQIKSPVGPGPASFFVGDHIAPSNDIFDPGNTAVMDNTPTGGAGNDVIWGREGANTMGSNGGLDVLVGGSGNEVFKCTAAGSAKMFGLGGNDVFEIQSSNFMGSAFSLVDGGSGNDTVRLGATTSPGQIFDFRNTQNFFNIEEIQILPENGAPLPKVQLDFREIFEMTMDDASHTLRIGNFATHGTLLEIFGSLTQVQGLVNQSTQILGGGELELTLQATLGGFTGAEAFMNGQSVTLIINQGLDYDATPSDGINVSIN
jgi:hypothetical protein